MNKEVPKNTEVKIWKFFEYSKSKLENNFKLFRLNFGRYQMLFSNQFELFKDITMKRILESLPSTYQADLISGLTNALSQFSEADVSLRKKLFLVER